MTKDHPFTTPVLLQHKQTHPFPCATPEAAHGTGLEEVWCWHHPCHDHHEKVGYWAQGVAVCWMQRGKDDCHKQEMRGHWSQSLLRGSSSEIQDKKKEEYYLPCVLIYTIKAKCFVNFYSKRKNITVHLYLFNSTLTFNRGHGHLNKYECTKLKRGNTIQFGRPLLSSAKEDANFSFAKGKTCSFSLTHF